jgi:hypothetical protein
MVLGEAKPPRGRYFSARLDVGTRSLQIPQQTLAAQVLSNKQFLKNRQHSLRHQRGAGVGQVRAVAE